MREKTFKVFKCALGCVQFQCAHRTRWRAIHTQTWSRLTKGSSSGFRRGGRRAGTVGSSCYCYIAGKTAQTLGPANQPKENTIWCLSSSDAWAWTSSMVTSSHVGIPLALSMCPQRIDPTSGTEWRHEAIGIHGHGHWRGRGHGHSHVDTPVAMTDDPKLLTDADTDTCTCRRSFIRECRALWYRRI